MSTKVIGGLLPPILVCVFGLACERRDVGSSQKALSPIIAVVNGKQLLQKDFNAYLPENYQSSLTRQEKREYLDHWINTEILYQAAMEVGVGQSEEIQARLNQFKKDLVADLLVQSIIAEKAVVTDAEVEAYYQAHIDEYTRELRVSHILLNTLEDAAEIKEQLKKRTFSWVARRKSIDRHTGPGGDLGYLSKGNMIPEFEEIVFDMKVGDISDVIESELGYHFIKITGIRDARNKLAFEDVAEDISRILLLEKRTAVYDSLISTLVGSAEIEILDPEYSMTDEAEPDTLLPPGQIPPQQE